MRINLFFVLISFAVIISKSFAVECPEGYYPVRAHSRNAYQKKDGTKVTSTNIKEQCRPFRALQTPILKFYSTMPTAWPATKEKFKAWPKSEETQVREVISSLPSKLTHIGEINFYRAVTDGTSNPAVSNSSNKIITIYDMVSSHDLRKVISHELAHIYWDSLLDYEQADFYKAAQWEIDFKKKAMSLRRLRIHDPDSLVGPHEDFSNSVEAFLFDKTKLANENDLLKCLERILK